MTPASKSGQQHGPTRTPPDTRVVHLDERAERVGEQGSVVDRHAHLGLGADRREVEQVQPRTAHRAKGPGTDERVRIATRRQHLQAIGSEAAATRFLQLSSASSAPATSPRADRPRRVRDRRASARTSSRCVDTSAGRPPQPSRRQGIRHGRPPLALHMPTPGHLPPNRGLSRPTGPPRQRSCRRQRGHRASTRPVAGDRAPTLASRDRGVGTRGRPMPRRSGGQRSAPVVRDVGGRRRSPRWSPARGRRCVRRTSGPRGAGTIHRRSRRHGSEFQPASRPPHPPAGRRRRLRRPTPRESTCRTRPDRSRSDRDPGSGNEEGGGRPRVEIAGSPCAGNGLQQPPLSTRQIVVAEVADTSSQAGAGRARRGPPGGAASRTMSK